MSEFCDAARRELSFLIVLGFREVGAGARWIRYRKCQVDIFVCHEDMTNEISLSIKAFGINYSIGEVVRLANPAVANDIRNVITGKEGVAEAALQRFASLLKEYGEGVLMERPDVFDALRAQRVKGNHAAALDMKLRQIRPRAEDAFRRKDYDAAVAFYSDIKEGLGPSELAKLAYAEKHRKK